MKMPSKARSVVAACTIGLVFAPTTGIGCASSHVVRRVDGADISDRFVPAAAYDAYIRARLDESRGNLQVARKGYLRVLQWDPSSAAARNGLGRIECASGPVERRWSRARRWFDEALRLLPRYVPALMERGRCALNTGHDREALRDATAAMKLDPGNVRASQLLESVLRRIDGKRGELRAQRVRRGWEIWTGRSWPSVTAGGEMVGKPSRIRRFLKVSKGHQGVGSTWARIDAALERGAVGEALVAAPEGSIDPRRVAVRAAALGLWQEASALVDSLRDADPHDADLWAVSMAVASAGVTNRSSASWPSADSVKNISALGVLVAADALIRLRREGRARTLLASHQPGGLDWTDPVVEGLRVRVLNELQPCRCPLWFRKHDATSFDSADE